MCMYVCIYIAKISSMLKVGRSKASSNKCMNSLDTLPDKLT